MFLKAVGRRQGTGGFPFLPFAHLSFPLEFRLEPSGAAQQYHCPGAEPGSSQVGPIFFRSRAPADQEHDAKGHRRPPAEAARRRHPELCQLHLQRLHPEVAAGVLGEAPTEERLRAALPARVLAEPTLGGTVALEDSSPVFAHLKLLPVLCFAHLPRRP